MQPRPHYATPEDPIEIRVEKAGSGKGRWRWSFVSGHRVVRQSDPVYGGAEEAYAAGRKAFLERPLRLPGSR